MTRIQRHKAADRLTQTTSLAYGQALMIAHAIDEALASKSFTTKFGTHGRAQLRRAMLHITRIEHPVLYYQKQPQNEKPNTGQ